MLVSTSRALSRSIPQLQKTGACAVCVTIDDYSSTKIYYPGQTITGVATICPPKDTPFSAIEVLFLGQTITRIETGQFPIVANHTILRLDMPLDNVSCIPADNILKRGQIYTIPFSFTIPSHLTLSACSNHVADPHIKNLHMTMPPSLGTWTTDDLSPTTAKIEYTVRCRALRVSPNQSKPSKIFEDSKNINIVPSHPERPPLVLDATERHYKLEGSKSLRKGLFSGGSRIGIFSVRTWEPEAIYVGSDGRPTGRSANLTLDLEFESLKTDLAAPAVTSVSAKIVAQTHYAGAGMTRLPDRDVATVDLNPKFTYQKTIPLFSHELSSKVAVWGHTLSEPIRRFSSSSTGWSSLPPRNPDATQTAQLNLPFTLPEDTFFLPSFYSCLVARTYTLKVSVTLASGTEVSLRVPVQIIAEAPGDMKKYIGRDGLPSFEEYIHEEMVADIDTTFGTKQENSEESLPDYDDRKIRGFAKRVL